MKFDDLVNRLYTEAHITDVMPKTFFEFVKKYKKLKADPYLFVQFTNHAGSNLQLGAHGSPDHADPVGVYGYPLKYVIEYPADIRYGSNAKYLRVLRNTSPMDTLVLTALPEWRAEGLMHKMGLDPMLLRQVGRHFKLNKNSSIYGKQLFGCIQHDFVNGKPVIRSGAEQTALLRKVCKAVEDRAKNRNTAIINPSEPQQIIFLSRDSFKVEEVFHLRQESSDNLMAKKDSDVTLAQRIANLVFRGLGDGIKEQTVSKHEKNPRSSGTFEFYSKRGALLSIRFSHQVPAQWSFSQPTQFKDLKTNTRSFPILELKGSRGTYEHRAVMTNTAQEVADDIVKRYVRQPEDPDFVPITKKSHEEEKQRAEEEKRKRISQEQLEQDRKEEIDFRENYLSMALKKYHIDIPLLSNFWYFKNMRYILQHLHRRVEDTHPQTNTALPEDLEYIWSNDNTLLPYLVKKYGEEDIMDNLKPIFNKIALGNPVWRNVYPWIVQMPK
jgi:hypothetical protein